ncbi:alcohol dehydrogenase catalytic domain-containing protein [Streptomyces sp. NPDC001880]
MNRRVVYPRGGLPADVLTVIEEPEPAAPEHGQILIRTTAFTVQPGDLQAIEAYPGKAAKPVPAGLETTGVVEAIGPGTRVAPGVEVGGRVTVFPQPGGVVPVDRGGHRGGRRRTGRAVGRGRRADAGEPAHHGDAAP